ncbi:hypothetical protein [Nocardia sp. NPDC057353]|uniref:hypothetical protein n=1 Tax=Nocardia sp. NPDC057353 TaxID=3346104 RepID=UPI00363A545D
MSDETARRAPEPSEETAMPFMAELADQLIRRGLVTPDAIRGCTDAEIAALRQAQGVRALPAAYLDFLAITGKNPYWLSRDGEWDYASLLRAKQTAREIVADDDDRSFAPFEDAYILQTHQGYAFEYFRGADLDEPDPPIWLYEEAQPERAGPSTFTGWIGELAADLPRLLETRRRLGIQA